MKLRHWLGSAGLLFLSTSAFADCSMSFAPNELTFGVEPFKTAPQGALLTLQDLPRLELLTTGTLSRSNSFSDSPRRSHSSPDNTGTLYRLCPEQLRRTRPNLPLLIGGAALFIIAWGPTLVMVVGGPHGASSNAWPGVSAVPIAGPWIALPDVKGKTEKYGVIASGVGQAVGAALIITSIALASYRCGKRGVWSRAVVAPLLGRNTLGVFAAASF